MTKIKEHPARVPYNQSMPSFSLAPVPPVRFPVVIERTRAIDANGAVDAESENARGWLTLAVGSLVLAGLLSLSVVIGRLPVLSRIIDDPLFFKRCLVVHVDLALVVWFYAFMAALLAVDRATSRGAWIPLALSAGGVLAMLAGALARGAQPILANYIPVIDQPVYRLGLAAFSAGVLLTFVRALATPARCSPSALPADADTGLRAAAVLVMAAAATWVSARAGLPDGLDGHTRAEFLAWGPGHVLQAANTAAMLAVWLWLAHQATGTAVLSRRGAAAVFAALVLPHCAMPLLTARGTLDTLYHSGATLLMRWTIFPALLFVLAACARHLWRHRAQGGVIFGGPASVRAADDTEVVPPEFVRTTPPCHRATKVGCDLASQREATSATSLRGERATNTAGARASEFRPGKRADNSSPAARLATAGFGGSAALAVLGIALGASIRGSTTMVPAHYHASLGAVTLAFMTAAYFICARARQLDRALVLPDKLWRLARRQVTLFGVGQTIFALGFALGGAYGLGRKAYAGEQHVHGAGELLGLIVMGVGGLVAAAGGLWFLFLILRELRAWWRRDDVGDVPPSPRTASSVKPSHAG